MLTPDAAPPVVWRKMGWFLRDRRGATAIEYSIIAGIMAVAVVAAFSLLQTPLTNVFGTIGNTIAAG